ncbi:MAG: alpha/beta hydrolase [Ignavibacteriales bacterium]|nr:alpha/beta hydrolase [Ignavibacteriales bacterium]
MAPVAKELSVRRGVLEPLQTAMSLPGQVDELRAIIEHHCKDGIALIGHSWGAWLSFILAARHPARVRKLVLVSAGPFEESYAAGLTETRLSRLPESERAEVQDLQSKLEDPRERDKEPLFRRFGQLMSKADSFDAIAELNTEVEFLPEAYQKAWSEAREMRRSGALLKLGDTIGCPVLAIHGDYDSHPAEGVRKPLSRILKDFRFELLPKCGHTPWLERCAQDRFYEILESELKG